MASVVMATGWSWEYVWENMTFLRLEAFGRIWKRSPPRDVSLAYITALLKAFMGVKDSSPALSARAEPPPFTQLPDFEE